MPHRVLKSICCSIHYFHKYRNNNTEYYSTASSVCVCTRMLMTCWPPYVRSGTGTYNWADGRSYSGQFMPQSVALLTSLM